MIAAVLRYEPQFRLGFLGQARSMLGDRTTFVAAVTPRRRRRGVPGTLVPAAADDLAVGAHRGVDGRVLDGDAEAARGV